MSFAINSNNLMSLIKTKQFQFISTNSASPTLLCKGIYNGEEYMCKMFISDPITEESNMKRCSDILGLKYETKVYELVSKSISKISPNFLKPAQILNMKESDILSGNISVYNQIYSYLESSYLDKTKCDVNSKDMTVIITPMVKGNSLNYYLDVLTVEDLQQIMAQIVISLMIMGSVFGIDNPTLTPSVSSVLMHNDLHTGNILLEKLPYSQDIIYKYPTESDGFKIKDSNYKVIIFDWDFSYSPMLNDNPKLTDSFCDNMGICNQYDQLFDFFTICCVIRDSLTKIATQNRSRIPILDSFKQFFYPIMGMSSLEINQVFQSINKYGFSCRLPRNASKNKDKIAYGTGGVRGKRVRFQDIEIPAEKQSTNPADMFGSILREPFIASVLS